MLQLIQALDSGGSTGSVAAPTDVPAEPADPELLEDFRAECAELLREAEADVMRLERAFDAESVHRALRCFHSLKGTSRALGLERVSRVAHRAESVLSQVRDQRVPLTASEADLAFRAIDLLETMVWAACRDAERARARGGANGAWREVWTRVHTDALHDLTRGLDELMRAHACVVRAAAGGSAAEMHVAVQRATEIMREIGGIARSLRSIQLRPMFQRLARVSRDAARRSGKSIDFIAEGESIEVDRSIVDVLFGPLVHMIRNAVDHGIEAESERRALGKPVCGRVQLTARVTGAQLEVRLADDGRGLDAERIRRKALARGLIREEDRLTSAELFELIFAPGMSTKEQVTDLSGRGVGMDVVRRNVEAMNGRIEIETGSGAGTSFVITLPLAAGG